MSLKRYPIGIQTFSEIIEGNYIYIDKTKPVYDLAQSYKYVFLSRPRRFGKSLLTSTFLSYFAGKKELFKNLAAGKLEKDWIKYPVLRFDMSTAKHSDEAQLESELNIKLTEYEAIYGKGDGEIYVNQRLEGLIKRAAEKTGQKAVVLIDEYDAPLLDTVTDDQTFETLHQIMRNFYSPLKACDPYLRFVFITGITKFSQLSIFSELNNLENISMKPEFSSICGITTEEITEGLHDEINEFSKSVNITPEEVMARLKMNYDGYHFSADEIDIFNPFSLLKSLKYKEFGSYWFESGTPTFLLEEMKRFGVKPQEIGRQEAWASAFDAPTQNMTSITPLLYQSGYLTIKGYDADFNMYTLDIPNKEVRTGLMNSMLSYVMSNKFVSPAQLLITDMARALFKDDIDKVINLLQTFLGTIPYTNDTNTEGHYQSMLFVVFSLMCKYVEVEVHTPKGRADIVITSPNKLYIIELKLDENAKFALDQINLKDYDERFALCGKPIVKVGVNFSSKERNITDWKVE